MSCQGLLKTARGTRPVVKTGARHGTAPILYIIDDYDSTSQVFVRREVDALLANGVPLSVFSLHPSCDRGDDWQVAPVSHLELARSAVCVMLTKQGRRSLREVGTLPRGAGGRRPLGQLYALLVAGHVHRAVHAAPAHIHAHFFGRCADVAYFLSRLAEWPFSVTGHAGEVLAPQDIVILRRNVGAAAGLVGESDLVRTRLTLLDGRSLKPAVTVRSGLPKKTLQRGASTSHVPGPSHRDPVCLLTTARLVSKKGLFIILEAARLLQAKAVPYSWHIIGDGPLRETLQHKLSSMGLSPALQLLGARDNDESLARLQSAHMFVLPCVRLPSGETDGLPAALIEAVALGTPVITTGVAAIPELVRHEQTGLVVPQHDPVAVVEAIMRLRDEPALYDRIASTGRRLGHTEYVLEDQVDRLREFFAASGAYAGAE